MAPIQAPERVSVPRPLSVQTSYPSPTRESSAEPPEHAESTDDSVWLTRGRIGDALASAARRQSGPVRGEILLASARLTTHVMRPVLEEELAVLVNAGRLVVQEVPDPARPMLARIRVYSAPGDH